MKYEVQIGFSERTINQESYFGYELVCYRVHEHIKRGQSKHQLNANTYAMVDSKYEITYW
jgi:hypothetical protein